MAQPKFMRLPLAVLLLALLITSCGSSKKKAAREQHRVKVLAGNTTTVTIDNKLPVNEDPARDIPVIDAKVNDIINTALSYNGTRYKYGGTTKRGMDCSGLLYISFQSADISLERSSSAMATQGEPIDLKEVRKGDLLFFTTGRSKKQINHVGLVVAVRDNEIRFIHATTSRGVMVSYLHEGYWNHAFHHARRIM